ncbi:MAG: glycolate oxidase iron-sulfur subunit, partial [Candidatus Fonsibacter sp.]
MLENNKPANEKIAKHIDRCLSCYACMTTCPSGVNYMHLIDHGRNHVEKTYKRPLYDRFIRYVLSVTLPNPGFFKFIGYLIFFFYPVTYLLPPKMRKMIQFMPSSFPTARYKNKECYSPEGKIYARVALLTGCVQRV